MKSKFKVARIIPDLLSVTGSRVVTVVISFFISIIIARYLGPEDKGVVTAIVVVPNLIQSFVDLGIRQATTFYTGKQVFRDQTILSTNLFLNFITTTIGIVVVVIIFLIAGFLEKYGWILCVAACLPLPFQLLITNLSGMLSGKRENKRVAIINALQPMINLIILFVLILIGIVNPLSVILSSFVASLTTALYVSSSVRAFGSLRMKYIPSIPSRFLKLGFVYAIALFIIGLNYRVDIIILEKLSTSTEVGIYSIGVGVAELLWVIQSAFALVNFSYSAASSDYSRKSVTLLKVVLFVSVIPLILLYMLSPWAIPLVYGEGFSKSALVVQALLPGIWVMSIYKILNSDLAGRGEPQIALWVFSFSLVLNIALNLLWIPRYGAVGCGWASSVSYTIGALLFGLVYSKRSNINFLDMVKINKSEVQKLFFEK